MIFVVKTNMSQNEEFSDFLGLLQENFPKRIAKLLSENVLYALGILSKGYHSCLQVEIGCGIC